MQVEDEERTRLMNLLIELRTQYGELQAQEMDGITQMIANGVRKAYWDTMNTLAALGSDALAAEKSAAEAASHYDSNTTTAPVVPGDDYGQSNVIADAESRRLMAIENQPEVVREVKVGELLHPGDFLPGNVPLSFIWGDIAGVSGWLRPVIRDIDPKYMIDKARSLAKSLTDPVQRERLLYTISQQQNALVRNLQLVIDEFKGKAG